MESTYYLFPIPEIENIILSYLDPLIDYQQLVSVNKYFYGIVNNGKTYTELKNYGDKQFIFQTHACPGNKIQQYFTGACIYGFLYAAKYLFSKYSDKINIHADREYTFRSSCRNGHLEMVQWLYRLDNKMDIHVYDEHPFQLSCTNGHLVVAKWLYGLDNKIDIHTDNEYAFRHSCEYGHLEVAKWLYGLDNKIDIHIDNEHAFKWSCVNGHLEIAQWLASLTDIYGLQIEDHKIIKYGIMRWYIKN